MFCQERHIKAEMQRKQAELLDEIGEESEVNPFTLYYNYNCVTINT